MQVENKWYEHFNVSPHDTDICDVVRPSPLLRYFQEAAVRQFRMCGMPIETLRQQDKGFLVSRLGVRVYHPLHAYDEIEVSTWPCDSKLSSFNRCGRITRKGEVVAELTSVWALLCLSEKRLLRTTDLPLPFGNAEQLDIGLPSRLRIPASCEERLCEVGNCRVQYADVDVNRHMNNTNYPDMLFNVLPDPEQGRVLSFSISFLSEAPLGENVRILRALDDVPGTLAVEPGETGRQQTYFFRTKKENGTTGVEAAFTVLYRN